MIGDQEAVHVKKDIASPPTSVLSRRRRRRREMDVIFRFVKINISDLFETERF